MFADEQIWPEELRQAPIERMIGKAHRAGQKPQLAKHYWKIAWI